MELPLCSGSLRSLWVPYDGGWVRKPSRNVWSVRPVCDDGLTLEGPTSAPERGSNHEPSLPPNEPRDLDYTRSREASSIRTNYRPSPPMCQGHTAHVCAQ